MCFCVITKTYLLSFTAVCIALCCAAVLQQEGWLSPMERASVSAISLRYIILLPHESHAGMSLPTADLLCAACRHLATSRESKAHFGLPGYIPGAIAVNDTWMERGFNACQMHRSMYPSIFNRFPVIQPVSLKIRHFITFFAHFCLPWVCPWDNRGKCYMARKRIQCWSNASQHVPIYLQPFTSYSEI